jgi:hypothetical protein
MSCCGTVKVEARPATVATVTPCECPIAGWCARHNMTKLPQFHRLCRTHAGYFGMYEQGKGPGQASAGPRRFTLGLGDVVAWLVFKLARGDEKRLTAIGIRADRLIERVSRGRFKANTDGTCNCKQRQAWLNQHFPIWPIRWPWGRK